MSRIKIEDIQAEIASDNWKLLSDTYENLDKELVFECNEGHKVYAPWKVIRQKRECPICKQNFKKLNDLTIIQKPKDKKRVFALDQATHVSGWSIFDDEDLIKFGLYETTLKETEERINEVKNWLINMALNWKPDYIYIEDIQLQQHSKKSIEEPDNIVGVTTYKVLAQLQGVLIDTAYELKIPFRVVSPSTWRAHFKINGKTKADKKKSAQLKVKEWYDVSVTNDEADAVCIGRYGANKTKVSNEIVEWGE